MSRTIKAIIFDFDGTLAPTNKYHIEAFKILMRREYRIELENKDFKRLFGMPETEVIRAFGNKFNFNVTDYETLKNAKGKKYLKEIKDKLTELEPSVVKLLHSLKKKGYKLGLGTGSARKPLEAVLGEHEEDFDVVITADDSIAGKPNPDLFLAVAKKLKVKPEACAVVEDAYQGIKAAQAAGMYSIAVTSGYFTKQYVKQAKPDLVIKDLDELKKVFRTFPKKVK